jgi:D-alanine-D-alanine ligase
MKIGLSYDLKEAVSLDQDKSSDALEEYDSLETIEAITRAIEAQGHSVVKLGGGQEFLFNISVHNVDLVFNIAEGRGNYRSREAQVPSVLEMLNIPYSGSDPQCLAICQDKALTKTILTTSGIRTPKWHVITNRKELQDITVNDFPLPAFVKPAHEGSSKGIRLSSRVENIEQMKRVVTGLLEHYQQPVMVEEFIAGEEVTVGIVGNRPPKVVGIMRILPRKEDAYFVYSLEVKRQWESMVHYECPPCIEASIVQEIMDSSLKIFRVLGCRDFARLDFRLSREGLPYFLEINPLPGLNPKSGDLPIMAAKMELAYQDLILAILHSALERNSQCVQI